MANVPNPPTLEDIVHYVVQNDLWGKVSPTKFHDYYAKQNFMFNGKLMDWEAQINKWASTQNSSVKPTQQEIRIRDKMETVREFRIGTEMVKDPLDYMNWAVSQI